MGQFDNELKSKQQKLNKSTTSTPTIGGGVVRSPLHMKGRRGWQNGHMIKVVNGKEVDKAVVVVPTDVVDTLLDDEDDDEDGENAKPLLSSNIRSGTKMNDQSWQRRGKDVLSPAKHQSPHSKKSLNDTATTKAAAAAVVVVGPNTTNNTTMAMRIPQIETKKLHTPTTKITTTTTTTPPVTSTNNLQRHSPSRCSPSPATLSRRRLQQRAAVFKMGDSSPTKPASVVGNNSSVLFNNIMNSSSSLDDAAVLVLSERNRLGSSNDGEKDTLTYETTIANKTNNIGGGGGAVLKTSTSPSRYSTQKITLIKKSEEDTSTNKSKEERDDTHTTREEGDDETTREEEDIPLKPFDATLDFASKRQAWANKFEKNKNKVASAQRLQHSSSRSPTKMNNQDSSCSSEGGVDPSTSSSTSESATISPVSKALMNSPSKYQHRQPSTVAVNVVNDRANISMPMKEIPAELAKPISQLYEKFDKKRQCHHNKGSVMKEPMVMYKKDDAISNSDPLPVFKQEVKNWSQTNSTPTQANTSQLFTISLTKVISMTTSPKEDMSVSSLREEKTKLEENYICANCTTKDDTEFETKWTSTFDFTNPSSDPFPNDPDMDELFFASNEFDSDDFSDAIMSTLKPKGFDDKEENDDEDNTDTFLSTFGEEVFNPVNTNNSQESDVEFNKEHDEEDLDTISSAFGDEVFDQAKDSTLDTSMMKATLWVAVKQGNFYEWSKQEAKRIDNERAASEIGNMKGHVDDDIAMIEESFKAGLSHEQKYLFTTIIARYETLLTSRQSEMESLMSESCLQQKQINTLLGIQKQIQLLVAKEQEPKPEHDHEKIECLNVEISNLRLQLAACEAALNQDSGNSNGDTASFKKNFMMSFWSKKKKSMRSQSKYYDDEVENESDI